MRGCPPLRRLWPPLRRLWPAGAALGLLALGLWRSSSREPPPAPDEAGGDEGPARLLPLALWAHRRAHPALYAPRGPACDALPPRDRLLRAAPGWQRLPVPGGDLLMYAAHWDARAPTPLVRVLVYCDVAPLPNITCLLWYEGRAEPAVVPASVTYGWRADWGGGPSPGTDEPYVLACAAPPGRPPSAVSLAVGAARCRAPLNALAVQGAEPGAVGGAGRGEVAACVKWLDYADERAGELAEWLELLAAMGARRVFVYTRRLAAGARRVLRWYAARGLAEATPLALPARWAAARGLAAARHELLPLNDRLYRAVARGHAWLAVLDMDEMIVPLRDATWPALIERRTRALRAAGVDADALVFLNYYFLRGAQRERAAPPPARLLADVWRARRPSPPGFYVKSFHNVSSVVAIHNHTPVSCGARPCRAHYVPAEEGRLQHHRWRCAGEVCECAELREVVRDAALWRAAPAQRVLAAARRTLRELRIPY